MHVMRTFLDEGAITFEGDFFKYTGLYTFARPVQDRIPIKMGAMKGPRSFQTAGELADGMHQALAYSREAYDYMRRARSGSAPRRPGATATTLDIGAWVVTVVGEDSAAAKQAARILVAFYISSMPPEQLARHGIEASELAPVVEALGGGRRREGGRAVRAPLRGEALPRGHARGGRREDQDRHRAGGRQPHDPRARRPGAGEALLAARTCRTCPTSRASSSSSPSG